MNRYRSSRRSSRFHATGPLVAFLLIASFGILFAGCGKGLPPAAPSDGSAVDDITFTEEDLVRFQRLASSGAILDAGGDESSQSSSDAVPTAPLAAIGSGSAVAAAPVALDLSQVPQYNTMRTMQMATENTYRVMNTFLNVRAEPRATASLVERLDGGAAVSVLEFVNAGWAKIKLADGRQGYAALQYLAKLTTEDKLAEEKKAFDNIYYVHFAFVNVRAQPDQKSGKLGQIPGQAFVRPLQITKPWARVSFQGKEGYVSFDYLEQFLPSFVVRQDRFMLPILRYRLSDAKVLDALADHVTRLKQAGVSFLTLRDFRGILLQQEQRKGVQLPAKAAVIVVSDVTPENVKRASDILYGASVPATFFLQTKNIGLSGVTQKMLLTLVANGFDIQSGAHAGDDLRSLTNAQVKLEVEQSRKILEEQTGKPVFALDYPQGGVNDRVSKIAADAGYLFGVGNAPDSDFLRDQFLRLPSYTVASGMTAEDILNIMK